MKKLLAIIFTLTLALVSLQPVLADPVDPNKPDSIAKPPAANSILGRLRNVATGDNGAYEANTGPDSAIEYASVVISVLLALLGIVFLYYMIYGGFIWMTAAGDKEKTKRAGAMIRNAIIGLLLVVGSYAIWTFVFMRLAAQNSVAGF